MVEGHRGVLLLHLAWNAQEAPYTAGCVEERHLLRVSVCQARCSSTHLSSQETEAQGSQIWGQPGLHGETKPPNKQTAVKTRGETGWFQLCDAVT